MFKSVEEYLDVLRNELKGSDAATIQDALADSEEHLRAALTNLHEKQPEMPEEEALTQVIEQYGSADETASAYKEVERRTFPGLARETLTPPTSALKRFLGIYDDPKAWGALLYMLISLVTGIVYFTWLVTGLSLSLSLAIFVFGLLFIGFFLVKVIHPQIAIKSQCRTFGIEDGIATNYGYMDFVIDCCCHLTSEKAAIDEFI